MAAAFDALARVAKIGQTVCLRLGQSMDSPEICGVLQDLQPVGLVIETDSGTEWVPAANIHVWRVPKQPAPAPLEITPVQTSTAASPAFPEESPTPPSETNKSPAVVSSGYVPAQAVKSLPAPADLELLFAGDPIIQVPSPSLGFSSLSKDIRQDINPCENRYKNALKIREPARLTQDVARIAELAETLVEPSLYFLAGLLADYSGLGSSRAKTYLQKTLELDQNHQDATTALAALAIRENDWPNAVKLLLWAVRLEGEADKANLVRCLGQCVLRLNEAIPSPIGALLRLELPETGRRLACSLVALAVREDTDAYSAALSGDFEQLRRTKIGNDLFPWKDEIAAPVEPRITKPTKVSTQDAMRRGCISVYYPARSFGFLVEDTTGQTWFFHRSEVISPSLLQSLTAGNVRQDITFSGITDNISGKYPLANNINVLTEDASTPPETTKRTPLKLRLQAIPKDGSFFARAMEAEQLDQLDRAETFYREEIANRGKHAKSSIKNLAALKNRKGKPEAAIELLDKYQSLFETTELTSLDQMRVQFLVKARKYADASRLLFKLANNPSNSRKRIEYLRQEAYCVLASGDFDKSIEKIRTLLRANPGDIASQNLLAKAEEAKSTGFFSTEVAAGKDDDEYDDLFSSLALGLSPVARWKIDNSELRGLDARTKESRDFSVKDFQQIERLLESLKGRRPREQADYLLTLASLCELAPESAGNRNLHRLLRWHFEALTIAATLESLPCDVIRCYAVESLALFPSNISDERDIQEIDSTWALLLATYSARHIETATLLEPKKGQRLQQVIRLYFTSPQDWIMFVKDAVYYHFRCASAFSHLILRLDSAHKLTVCKENTTLERTHLRDLDRALTTVPLDTVSANRLRQSRESLAQLISGTRFDLDRSRLTEFVKLLGDISDYALERHFRERENRYLRLLSDISRLEDEMQRLPTDLSIARLLPVLSSLRNRLKEDFTRTELAKPDLDLRNVLDNDFYVLENSSIALRLLLVSRDESTPPIEAISLIADQVEKELCHSPDPLHGGQTREIELLIKPSEKQIVDGTFSVNVVIEYRNREGRVEKTQPFSLAVRLGKQSFEEIPNPYGRYSGGSPVEDEEMFFGRAALIDRVIRYLSSGSLGQCFVLYGQKRSGKSSVLKQVERRLGNSVLFAPISAGTFAPSNLWGSFARLLLQELTFRLEDAGVDIPDNWPSRSDVEASPLETIRDTVRGLTKRGYQLVVAIDEFTYIYENAQVDVESFMRGWKALLEARTFNALLVGQDTMPRFKQAFPNEFGVTHDERISYLTEEEAAALASKPILLEGLSRYRGQALHRLFDLTAGSPFFLQIACDRLVRHLNSRKAAFVTEADIDQIARMLTVGNEVLPPERFDALVTAAGEKVATIPRDNLWRVLGRIARESLHSGWCYRDALAELPRSSEAVKDLVDREILAMEGERVSIRVGLFAAWLRANQQME